MIISQYNKEGLKNPWVLGMMLFLAIFLAVNAILIYYAYKLPPNLVDKNYYEDGENYLAIQKKIDQQKALGWTGILMLPSVSHVNQSQQYDVLIQGKNATALELDSVVFKAYRPSDYRSDFSATLSVSKPSTYSSNIKFPLPGTWDIVVVAHQGDKEFLLTRRITIKP